VKTSSIAHLVVKSLGLQRIGEAQSADDQIGLLASAPIQLPLDVLPLGQPDLAGQQRQLRGEVTPVKVGRADLGEPHAELAREKAGDRHLELRIGEDEQATCPAAVRAGAPAPPAPARPVPGRPRSMRCRVDAEGVGGGTAASAVVPSTPSGKGAGSQRAARSSRARAVSARKGCGQQEAGAGPDRGQVAHARRAGRSRTSLDAQSPRTARANWSSTTSASAPTTMQRRAAHRRRAAGSWAPAQARQASSPWVKVVSMPLPE
jgi:hypothetical protein